MLKEELRTYDIVMEAPTSALNRFEVQEFSELQKGSWEQFRSFASGSGYNYIVGGKLEITKEGFNSDQRLFLCSGSMSVEGFGTNDGVPGVTDGGALGESSGGSEEGCQSSLAGLLAKKLADKGSSEKEQLDCYRKVRDEIRDFVKTLPGAVL